MKLSFFFIAFVLSVALCFQAFSEDKHDHKNEGGKQEKSSHENESEEGHAHDEGEEHKDEHGEGGGHGHEEGGSVVGPDKGIVEKGPLGIKLSPEAVSTIRPETILWQAGSMSIPYIGLVRIKESKSVYRVRNGFYKRVAVNVESRQGDRVVIRVPGLEAGDQIVISQTGFLRIAEVITEEGASHSHAH